MERRVTFEVEGDTLVGTLFLPEGEGPWPGVVLEGPLTSVKEQATGNHARALSRHGFACLAFDHRTFGESGGEPRQHESPPRKVEDLGAAVDLLRELPEVDGRVAAVGVCAGAGYLAPFVADDDRVAAWGTVAGFFHDAAQQRQWMGGGYDAALERAREARRRYEETGEAETIPAVGPEGEEVAMPLAEAFAYYGTPRGQVGHYVNAFAVLSREDTLPWDAQAAAPRITVPTLMIHSERALAPSLARRFFDALAGPKEDVWVESEGQIDFYDDPRRIEPAAERLAAHFRASLGATVDDVLDFWFREPAGADEVTRVRRWFQGGPEMDAEVTRRFGRTVEAALAGELDGWARTPRGRLALVLVLDQLTRNHFRGDARTHEGDPRAQRLSLEAFEQGLDRELGYYERMFLCMPLLHAEDLEIQHRQDAIARRIVAEAPPERAKAAGMFLEQSEKYTGVVSRFGRFPHRNALLGRTSTPEEEAFLANWA